jgi:hypothetical protein
MPLLALLGTALAAGGAGFLLKTAHLQLQNLDRPVTIRVPVAPGASFSIIHVNSIYDAPVAEEFRVEGGALALTGVRTGHPGVREYYGFDDGLEFHPVSRPAGELRFLIGMLQPQILVCGQRRISFHDLGENGERVRLRVIERALALELASRVHDALGGRH